MTFKLEKVLRIFSKIILNMKLSLKNDEIGLFKNVVVIVFQSVFHIKIY